MKIIDEMPTICQAKTLAVGQFFKYNEMYYIRIATFIDTGSETIMAVNLESGSVYDIPNDDYVTLAEASLYVLPLHVVKGDV